jgi:hypothetical protein
MQYNNKEFSVKNIAVLQLFHWQLQLKVPLTLFVENLFLYHWKNTKSHVKRQQYIVFFVKMVLLALL